MCVRTAKIFHDSTAIQFPSEVLFYLTSEIVWVTLGQNSWFCSSMRHPGISCVIACLRLCTKSVSPGGRAVCLSVCHSFVSFQDRYRHRSLQQSPAGHIVTAVPLQGNLEGSWFSP